MRPTVLAAFPAFTRSLEGACSWMYPDALELVTTGYGNKIDSVSAAQALPWVHTMGNIPARLDEIAAAWRTVKASGLGKLGGGSPRIQALTDLRLLPEAIDDLVASKLHSDEAFLVAHFGAAYTFTCADAQLGILSLAWACGPAAITEPGEHHFPKFARAFAERDYPTCAVECEMPASANPGNHLEARNRANTALFEAAAKVDATGGCPDELTGWVPR